MSFEEASSINKEVNLRKKINQDESYTKISKSVIENFFEEDKLLEEFYAQVNPELLDDNFKLWEGHLNRKLAEKYPDNDKREKKLAEFSEFANNLPLIHVINIANNRSLEFFLKELQLDSNFRLEKRKALASNRTFESDKKVNLDKFVFSSFGVSPYFKSPGNVAIILNPDLLEAGDTLVTFDDISETEVKLMLQGKKDDKTVWQEYLKEIWRGKDFRKLFPMMAALSFISPEEYLKREGFTTDIYPDHVIKPDQSFTDRHKNNFEIKVPKSIMADNFLFLAYIKNFSYPQFIEDIEKLVDNQQIFADRKLVIASSTNPSRAIRDYFISQKQGK